jgi:DNA-binding NtrC family response regulator
MHVLLVEDHPMLRRVLERTLRENSFDVTVADSGDSARALLEQGLQVDCLFTDIRMPGRINGLELALWAKQHRPAIAVLLQTGYTDIDTGDLPVLRKPYPPDALVTAIRAALEKR